MLAIERIAMLGDTIASAETTIRAIVGDDTNFGATDAEHELSLTLWRRSGRQLRRCKITSHLAGLRWKRMLARSPRYREKITRSSESSLCDRTPTCS